MVPERKKLYLTLPNACSSNTPVSRSSWLHLHNPADNCACEMADASTSAQRRWELENNVQVDEEVEGFFRYNHAEQQAVQQQKPWSKDPHLYKQ